MTPSPDEDDDADWVVHIWSYPSGHQASSRVLYPLHELDRLVDERAKPVRKRRVKPSPDTTQLEMRYDDP